jgi:hypothetical protein
VSDPERPGLGAKGRIENFAIRSAGGGNAGRVVDPWPAVTASGSAMIDSWCPAKSSRRALELRKPSWDACRPPSSIIDQYWRRARSTPSAGLPRHPTCDFRNGRASILLPNGSFEKGAPFPRGAERWDGLAMAYKTGLRRGKGNWHSSEAATFHSRPAFTLDGVRFRSLDDDYAFYGSASSPAAPSRPRGKSACPFLPAPDNGYGQVV